MDITELDALRREIREKQALLEKNAQIIHEKDTEIKHLKEDISNGSRVIIEKTAENYVSTNIPKEGILWAIQESRSYYSSFHKYGKVLTPSEIADEVFKRYTIKCSSLENVFPSTSRIKEVRGFDEIKEQVKKYYEEEYEEAIKRARDSAKTREELTKEFTKKLDEQETAHKNYIEEIRRTYEKRIVDLSEELKIAKTPKYIAFEEALSKFGYTVKRSFFGELKLVKKETNDKE